jgi:RimJ/RimL family protein N-acetyltransferase
MEAVPTIARQPSLDTVRLLLRPLTPADAPAVQRLAGDKEVASTTLNIPHPYPDGAAELWIGTLPQAYDSGEAVVFGIALHDGGELVGTCGLRLELPHARAEIGYWVGREYWGRGVATEAARRVVDLAFEHFGVWRVWATCAPQNPASRRVLEKVGMRHEGVLRRWIVSPLVSPEPRDSDCLAITRDDWLERGGLTAPAL